MIILINVEQGTGGHWFYNNDMQGNARCKSSLQTGEWHEAEITMLTGDRKYT